MHVYPICWDFGEIYASLTRDAPILVEDFTIVGDFLFRDNCLRVRNVSLRDNLICELHTGRAMKQFGCNKAIILMKDRIFWAKCKVGCCEGCFTVSSLSIS